MSELTRFREEKDQFMKHHPQSPLMPEQRQTFEGLKYYPENPDLRFEVDLVRYEDPEVVEMATSTGDEAEYLRFGYFEFEVEGRKQTLHVYKDPQQGHLFLPFTDATRGKETYGAGRYLEVELLNGDKLLVDFNYAYNPYCAYNEMWRCPIAPAENRLEVPIRAGEKKFKDE